MRCKVVQPKGREHTNHGTMPENANADARRFRRKLILHYHSRRRVVLQTEKMMYMNRKRCFCCHQVREVIRMNMVWFTRSYRRKALSLFVMALMGYDRHDLLDYVFIWDCTLFIIHSIVIFPKTCCVFGTQ